MANSSGSSTHWGESEHKHGLIAISTTWERVPRSTFRLPIFERREPQGQQDARRTSIRGKPARECRPELIKAARCGAQDPETERRTGADRRLAAAGRRG